MFLVTATRGQKMLYCWLALSYCIFLLGLNCRLTEADLRLYPTIIRYDSAYAILFKCSRRRVSDYPHLQAWLRDMYQLKVPSEGLQVSPPVHCHAAVSAAGHFLHLF